MFKIEFGSSSSFGTRMTSGSNFNASMETGAPIVLQHNALLGRDSDEAHPISSISGLTNELEAAAGEALSIGDIEKLLF